jgi:hypothetical protein
LLLTLVEWMEFLYYAQTDINCKLVLDRIVIHPPVVYYWCNLTGYLKLIESVGGLRVLYICICICMFDTYSFLNHKCKG